MATGAEGIVVAQTEVHAAAVEEARMGAEVECWANQMLRSLLCWAPSAALQVAVTAGAAMAAAWRAVGSAAVVTTAAWRGARRGEAEAARWAKEAASEATAGTVPVAQSHT